MYEFKMSLSKMALFEMAKLKTSICKMALCIMAKKIDREKVIDFWLIVLAVILGILFGPIIWGH